MKVSVVMDTNVLVSGMLWRGVPFRLLRWAEEGILTVFISLDILEEVHRVLHYPKFQQYIDIEKTTSGEFFTKIESLNNGTALKAYTDLSLERFSVKIIHGPDEGA
jgi:uncharacterized protein